MATPFSKGNLGATPTQFTSSPHSSAVPMGRPLSHKSPSMRTPSASGPGHHNHSSISSHQYPTPLPVSTAAIEDAATFSSPSALLALGLGGITPAANDALAGHGMNESDMHSMAIPPLSITGPKDIDEERRKRIDEVVQLLRTRLAGRGVCREGVKRLGRLEGLECMWQDNDLSIAGNSLDLEIEFEAHQEVVKDVTLRYATPDAPEGERRAEASEVLKRNLKQPPGELQQGRWRSMTEFHENLRRLARLDRLSREVNCFEAVEGVYECLKRIWEEEKRQNMWQSHWEHMCKGWVGKPSMHRGQHIGLMLEYWVKRRRVLEFKQAPSENAMDFDQPVQAEDEIPPGISNVWGATIECETGYPSLRVSKDWVTTEVFTTINHAGAGDNGSEMKVINWAEPPPTLVSSLGTNLEVALEPTILSSTTPDIRFVARLEPPVDMPIFAASEIYRVLGVNMMQEFKNITYDSLLIPSQGNSLNFAELDGRQTLQKRDICTFDANGKPMRRQHTYTFNAFEQVPGRTIRDLPFSHPRQLTEVLPVLRQYALLSSLLRRIFENSKKEAESEAQNSSSENPESEIFREERPNGYYISNINPTERRLESVLRDGKEHNVHASEAANLTQPSQEIRVDISLRTPMSFSPSMLLVFSVDEDPNAEHSTSRTPSMQTASRQVMINVDIGLNGDINIPQISGVWPEDGVDDMVSDEREAEKRKLCMQIARVLETCEDYGMLIEWVLRWMRKRREN
ncbi:hypothetical protein PRK78_006370 [Emydomyces testavorans]|uniref:Mediator of RNA polymerase II transcription subunit 1 n=1 Tax=Emydomyces testavorans TaxID=2070801 RepID=A0AAF0ILK6_9EURO|nr:hypothetical protein PRK78_006370 [Emydomyces testavorans]